MQTPREKNVKNLFSEDLVWIGFVITAMVGGLVGFIKDYERAGVETTWRAKAWGILRRVIMAGFAGHLLFQLSVEYSVSQAWGGVAAGIVGMFAAEFFEVLWVVVRARMQAITGAKK